MHECDKESKIEKLADKIVDLEKAKERTDLLVEMFVETTKELSNTMKKVEQTMVSMTSAIENNEDKVDDLAKKVDRLREKEEENEEMNKIDIRVLLKEHILKVGMGGLGLYGVYELATKVIEKLG